jgi:hypothetical protein
MRANLNTYEKEIIAEIVATLKIKLAAGKAAGPLRDHARLAL